MAPQDARRRLVLGAPVQSSSRSIFLKVEVGLEDELAVADLLVDSTRQEGEETVLLKASSASSLNLEFPDARGMWTAAPVFFVQKGEGFSTFQ